MMNFEEFLSSKNEAEKQEETLPEQAEVPTNELDVQKAVVESLAADKAKQDEKITHIEEEKNELKAEVERLKAEGENLIREIAELKSELSKKLESTQGLEAKIAEQQKALANVGEVLAKNAETEGSNKIALLDRDVELPDRFPGETRDHVLEVLKEAKERAESEGRVRRAQILESVLVANEPSGALAEKRGKLQHLFTENQNLVTGVVIQELQKNGISHKNGEQFLMASEIMKRNF